MQCSVVSSKDTELKLGDFSSNLIYLLKIQKYSTGLKYNRDPEYAGGQGKTILSFATI